MSQVSQRKMDSTVQAMMFEMFLGSFSKCKDPEEVANFLGDILTETEAIVMAKRLAIALMLTKGYNYNQICDFLKVTPPTISKVKSWLSMKGEGFRAVLNAVLMDPETEAFWGNLGSGAGK